MLFRSAPRGLARAISGADITGLLTGHIPFAGGLTALALSSPRVAGELSYLAGRTSGSLPMLAQGLNQGGRLNQIPGLLGAQ